jgi:hypothetical protein
MVICSAKYPDAEAITLERGASAPFRVCVRLARHRATRAIAEGRPTDVRFSGSVVAPTPAPAPSPGTVQIPDPEEPDPPTPPSGRLMERTYRALRPRLAPGNTGQAHDSHAVRCVTKNPSRSRSKALEAGPSRHPCSRRGSKYDTLVRALSAGSVTPNMVIRGSATAAA